jgi:hypothetical protein
VKYLMALVLLAGCATQPCIQPPPTSTQETRDIIIGLSAKFSAIPVSPTLQTDFKQTVNTVYQQLNDVNTAYYVAFQAAYCFAKEGKFGQEIARQILKDLEDDWKKRSGNTTVDQHPQALEIKAGTQAIQK